MATYVNNADFDTYLDKYGGTDISGEDNFEQLLELSELDINTATFDRITNFSILTTHQQNNIKYAVCSHAQTLFDYGDTGVQIDSGKVSLGDLSVDGGNSSVLKRMSNRTKDFLSLTGLSTKTLSYGKKGYWYR